MTVLLDTVAVAPDPADSGLFLIPTTVTSWPDPDVDGEFNIVVFPTAVAATQANSEIVRVVSRTVAGWSIKRAQSGSTARSIVVGDSIVQQQPHFLEILDANMTDVVVTGTGQTSIYSYVVPGNMLMASAALRVDLSAELLQQTGVNRQVTLRVKYGATTLFGDISDNIGSSGAPRGVNSFVLLMADAASNAQKMTGLFTVSDAVGPSVAGYGELGGLTLTASFGGSSAEDSTADKTLDITIQPSFNDAANFKLLKHSAYLTRIGR